MFTWPVTHCFRLESMPLNNDFPTGVLLGNDRYRIEELQWRGEWGDVYRAYDTHAMRVRTLKITAMPVTESIARFQRECYALQAIQHDNVINPIDYGCHEGMPYYVTEYVPTERLDLVLLRSTILPFRFTLDILNQLVDAIVAADSKQILHRAVSTKAIHLRRSIKPPTDDGVSILLMDFGFAKILDPAYRENPRITAHGPPIPCAQYAAPEVIDRQPHSIQSEMFSIGAVGYELLAGVPLFPRATFTTRRDERSRPLRPLHEYGRHVPRALADVVMRCLQPDPQARFRDATELRNELADAERRIPIRTTPARGVETMPGSAIATSAGEPASPLDPWIFRLAAKRLLDDGCGSRDLQAAYYDAVGADFIADSGDQALTLIKSQLRRARELRELRGADPEALSGVRSVMEDYISDLEAGQRQTETNRERLRRILEDVGNRLEDAVRSIASQNGAPMSAFSANLLQQITKIGGDRDQFSRKSPDQ